ncbi:MAG: hypothetical protein EXS37_16585 [Opitutus sp.]|nr:hypothetical protein [Opitutus sp.]
MHLPLPNVHPKPALEPPAMIRTATREDVQWNRPVFKAPPLQLHPQAFDATIFAEDLRRIGLGER